MLAQDLDLAAILQTPGAAYARYQRIVELRSHRAIGHESLLHAVWRGREISPGELFGGTSPAATRLAAERLGFEAGVRDSAGWLRAHLLFLKAGPAMLAGELDPGFVMPRLKDQRLPASQVVIALPALPGVGPVRLRGAATRCAAAGLQVAITAVRDAETMGTVGGRAQWAVLDRSVTIDESAAGRAHLDGIVAVARGHGVRLIGFGVETEAQAARLLDAGVEHGQGWLFGRPRRPTVG